MLRKLLMASVGAVALTGSALAADLPSRAPPPVYLPPAPIFTWTGVYLGGQIGYAWTKANTYYNDSYGTSFFHGTTGFYDPGFDRYNINANANGVIGGAHVGYNLQISQWVLGLEGDVDGSSLSKTWNASPYSYFYGGYIPTTVHSTLGIQGSVRGRVGIAFDRVLLYGTGGVAFGGFNSSVNTSFYQAGNHFSDFGFHGGNDSFSQTRVGWTAGAGLEYAVTNNWSIRAEYRYTSYGQTTNYLVNGYSGDGTFFHNPYIHRNLAENRVQVGFSYKFDTYHPAPVVAKY